MVIRGRVENGVIVFKSDIPVPDGTEVTVIVGDLAAGGDQALSEEEFRRVFEIMDRIAALPIEGKTEPFCATDHDRILYMKP